MRALRRQHSGDADRERGRRLEPRFYVGLLFLGASVGIHRIGADLFDVQLFTTRQYFFANSLFVQVVCYVAVAARLWCSFRQPRIP